jgi:hypothetical protein
MNIIPAIILIVIAAIAGYVFGMMDSRVTQTVKDKLNAPAEEPKKSDDHVVLAVKIDPALKWRVELDGVPVEPAAITAEQRARLVNAIVQIRPWIDAKPAPPPAPEPASPVRATPQPIAAAPGLSAQPQEKAAAPKTNVIQGFRSLLQNDVTKNIASKPTLSIVQMIDDVLQKNLATSPLASKKIRLEEGSIGEVIVFIDKDRYPSIDAVPDEDVKAIIRAAIAEWEKKA